MSLRPLLFDASALLKLFLEEAGSENARTLFERSSWNVTTWLCVAETYARLKRLCFFEKDEWLRLDEDRYCTFLFVLNTHIQSEKLRLVGSVVFEPDLYLAVRKIIKEHRLDFSDAMQLLAIEKYANLIDDSRPVIVTTDEGIIRAARSYGLLTYNPKSSDELPVPEIRPLQS